MAPPGNDFGTDVGPFEHHLRTRFGTILGPDSGSNIIAVGQVVLSSPNFKQGVVLIPGRW